MIVKILPAASRDFNGVSYNHKKREKGTGELMAMKNFPTFINKESTPDEVKDYFKSISQHKRVKNSQFHATISTKFREHSKEELTTIAEEFMKEFGYGTQPYIVVFHNDTDNNHVHLVTTRVDKAKGRKIKDSFEKIRAQKALIKAQDKVLGTNHSKEVNALLNYKYSSLNQLKLLLQGAGYKMVSSGGDGIFQILKNGANVKTVNSDQITFSKGREEDAARRKQLKAILYKHSQIYSNKVFKTIDTRDLKDWQTDRAEEFKPKIQFESELQNALRKKLGIEIQFNRKDDLTPFGYTLIDHKNGRIYKGRDLVKMKDLFEFTNAELDKKMFEQLKDFNVDDKNKDVLLNYLETKGKHVLLFMLFENKKRKPKDQYQNIRNDVQEFLKNKTNRGINLFKVDDKWFVVHSHEHFIGELKEVVGDWYYEKFERNDFEVKMDSSSVTESSINIVSKLNNVIDIFAESSYSKNDPTENDLKKKKKKRR